MLASCPQGQHLDPIMKMCMPNEEHPSTTVMFHLNQFMVYSNTSGPRGQSRATGPGQWMLMLDRDVSTQHHLSINVMGSLEQWTVGDKGTPQLFQTEHVDSMHAHDTVMALEFRDVVALAPGGTQKLTLLFAPRGEAAVGPVPFMHRESAEGNPDAPLGHTQQDGFHDASTVFGLGYHIARTTAEVTAFSGQSISWPFPMHLPGLLQLPRESRHQRSRRCWSICSQRAVTGGRRRISQPIHLGVADDVARHRSPHPEIFVHLGSSPRRRTADIEQLPRRGGVPGRQEQSVWPS